MLLETYSALPEGSLNERLPSFLRIERQVTGDPKYSMFNLSLREDWKNSKKFCHNTTPMTGKLFPVAFVVRNYFVIDAKRVIKTNGHANMDTEIHAS